MASYLEDALIAGETILHQGRVSWWSVWHLLAVGVILLPVAVGVVFLAWAWIRVKSTELAITAWLPWQAMQAGTSSLAILAACGPAMK